MPQCLATQLVMDCRVLFDYKAGEEDELDLKKGEQLSEVISGGELEDGWWSGVLNGKRGVFPNNFVEPITVPPPTHSNNSPPSNSVGHNAPKYSPAQSDPALRTGVNRVQRAKVTFSYKPANPDELKLEIGEIVEIFSQVEDGWMSGSSRGMRGVFPSNFVEMIEESAPAFDSVVKDPKSKVPVGGIALPILPTQGGKPSEKKIERAKVTFSYEPQEDDELKLEVGDTVEVLNKEHAEGWWEGRLGTRTGVFPNNFVELFPDTAQKSAPNKALLKPTQAPRTELDTDPSLPRKPSIKAGPIQAPKRSGPTNELQRKLDRRNKLNVGPEPAHVPTDNGTVSQVIPQRTNQEEVVIPEEQKAPPRRQSHDPSRPSIPKVPDNVDLLVRTVDASEMEQMRAEMAEMKKELVKLKQEYRDDFDRLLEEEKEDRKQLAEMKIEVDSLKKRRADYWNPEKFF